MKKTVSILLAAILMIALLAACNNDSGGGNTENTPTPTPTGGSGGGVVNADDFEDPTFIDPGTDEDNPFVEDGIYWNEATQSWKFTDTRKISVEVFDRGLEEDKTPPEDCYWSNWISDQVKEALNVEIEWIPVARFSGGGEEQLIASMLMAGTAPDVSYTYNFAAIQEFGDLGGVMDLNPLLEKYKTILPNMWKLLGNVNIYSAQDPDDKHLYWIEGMNNTAARINTFVREDWLKTLSLDAPTDLQSFEDMLVAFRDNADTLLGADAARIIPFTLGVDIGWRANNMIVSFVPDDLSDKDAYVYGFDDRQFMFPNYKEGVRVLNKWYNMNLIWKDFSLYDEGDTTEDNNMKVGLVGAYMGNWDYVYRNGENSINEQMKKEAGPDANFIAVDCFKNDKGEYRKFLNTTVGDRKIFFTNSNTEPLASLLYLDWISRVDVYAYLQKGEEGINHEMLSDGAIQSIAARGTEYIQNSPFNIDYTMTLNNKGLIDVGDPVVNGLSMALGFTPVEPRLIAQANVCSLNGGRTFPDYNFGKIESESGMANPLKLKRNALLNDVVNAPEANFDDLWDAGYKDYMNSGGQAVIDERKRAWEKYME